MKKIIFITCLGIFLSLMANSCQAVLVQSIYQAIVPVADYTIAAREKIFPEALQQVLVKVSGNINVATIPSVHTALNSAKLLVDSYGYFTVNNAQNGKPLMLQVNFSQQGVKNILAQAKQSLWSVNRPQVLVWLVVPEDNGDNILGSDGDDKIVQSLQKNADRLGLPLVLPVMDLQDLEAVTLNDVNTANLPVIISASKRYKVDVILIGQISNLNSKWQSTWLLSVNGDSVKWNIIDNDIDSIITKVTNNVITRLATKSDNEDKITIVIKGIAGLDQYSAALKYLHSLDNITRVEVVDLGADYVKLQLTGMNNMQEFANALNDAEPKLSKISAAGIYKWVATS